MAITLLKIGDFFLERVVKIKQPGDNPRHLPSTGSSMENR